MRRAELSLELIRVQCIEESGVRKVSNKRDLGRARDCSFVGGAEGTEVNSPDFRWENKAAGSDLTQVTANNVEHVGVQLCYSEKAGCVRDLCNGNRRHNLLWVDLDKSWVLIEATRTWPLPRTAMFSSQVGLLNSFMIVEGYWRACCPFSPGNFVDAVGIAGDRMASPRTSKIRGCNCMMQR